MASSTLKGRATNQNHEREGYGATCARCGARRIDQQIGLEPTPEEWRDRLVEVFREVRRVLVPTGTLWLEVGDSYASSSAKGGSGPNSKNSPAYARGSREPLSWETVERLRAAGSWETAEIGAEILHRRSTPDSVVGLKPKDLIGSPFLLAFGLRDDGWWWRSTNIWHKPNCLPESVTDRPVVSHSYVFQFSKKARYFHDAEAVREPAEWDYWGSQKKRKTDDPMAKSANWDMAANGREALRDSGRSLRSVWQIPTQPYAAAHFATWPEALASRILLMACPESVCRVCGKARERITDGASYYRDRDETKPLQKYAAVGGGHGGVGRGPKSNLGASIAQTTGFTDCGHSDYRCEDCGVVLDSCDNPWHVENESMRAVWSADLGEGSVVSDETVLHEDVLESLDGAETSGNEGVRDGREGLPAPEDAGSPQGIEGRLHHGTPLRDGADARPSPGSERGGASQERGQGRQSPGESGSDAQADTRPSSEATASPDHLSALRREDHYVGTCPTCNGRLERVPDSERFRPGVALDPFVGSGTTCHVARKLGRRSVGIDLSAEYLDLAAKRLQQQSLFA